MVSIDGKDNLCTLSKDNVQRGHVSGAGSQDAQDMFVVIHIDFECHTGPDWGRQIQTCLAQLEGLIHNLSVCLVWRHHQAPELAHCVVEHKSWKVKTNTQEWFPFAPAWTSENPSIKGIKKATE